MNPTANEHFGVASRHSDPCHPFRGQARISSVVIAHVQSTLQHQALTMSTCLSNMSLFPGCL